MHKEHNDFNDNVLLLCDLCEIIEFFVFKEAFDKTSSSVNSQRNDQYNPSRRQKQQDGHGKRPGLITWQT